MNGKHYIGKRVSSFELYDEIGPFTGVALVIDENNEVFAGDATGYVLEVECPYATPLMANNALRSIVGRTYRGFRATGARIGYDAELGDSVDVNGISSMLAYKHVNFGPNHVSEIAAPGENTVDHEYPYTSQTQKEIRRNKAETFSLISKTAEAIRQEVSGKLDGAEASAMIETAIKGITLAVSSKDGSTTFTLTGAGATLSTKTLDLSVDAVNISGKLTASQIDATELKVNAANITGSISFSQLGNDVTLLINSMAAKATDAKNTVGAWTYEGGTYIDGRMIMTGTVMASQLLGGRVGLLNRWKEEIGRIAIGSSSSSDYSIELESTYGALRLTAGGGDFWVDAYYGSMGITASGATFNVPPIPLSSGGVSLGTYGFRWSQVYAATGEINTSDLAEKNSIYYDLERYDALFDSLKPCSYKLNDGTSNRRHVGMISQEVESALGKTGLTSLDFAGFIKSPKDEGGYAYGLRYSEFIAMNIWQIQQLKARVAELEAKL